MPIACRAERRWPAIGVRIVAARAIAVHQDNERTMATTIAIRATSQSDTEPSEFRSLHATAYSRERIGS